MINLFTSQASTWRGGTVKPVEPSFFWYCGGGLSSFYCCSFTLLSILYSTSFQTSEFTGYWLASQGADCKFMQSQHVRYSNHHLLRILLFLLLLMLLLVACLACLACLPPLDFTSKTHAGHHRRESGLPLLCPLSPV